MLLSSSRTRVAAPAVPVFVAAVLALCAATACGQSRVASAGRFDFTIVPRIFDGVEISTIRLRSAEVTLVTDTFGAWLPLETPRAGAGFSLRHGHDSEIGLNIFLLRADRAEQNPEAWQAHLAAVKAQLGESAVISNQLDSINGLPASRTLGWRTREATVTSGSSAAGNAFTEQHVFAAAGNQVVLFVLSARTTKIAHVMDDFRLFLDRLELTQAK